MRTDWGIHDDAQSSFRWSVEASKQRIPVAFFQDFPVPTPPQRGRQVRLVPPPWSGAQWPELGIEENSLILDGGQLRSAAARAKEFWPADYPGSAG
ncbi:hypothetical protein [Paenarthrobacter nitroguajacolicus]|uniref:hypothetical protein n=1 Tax=Paenarthrobacter nitroguajacolicus TaxID=211146 RepID=UPI00248CC81C|nr:hypothetical protein [Paenarthrobacter nitroguajacolicus]